VSLSWIDRMAVEIDGPETGAAVVMVHGLGGTTNTWTPLLPALPGFRCIRIELPGAGRSARAHALQDSAPAKGALSIGVLVDAVLRVVGQLGLVRAHFVGHSLGTIVCQHLAVKAPDRVQSLALFGALLAPPDAARAGLAARATKARAEGLFGIADAIVGAALSASTRQTQPVTVAMVRESVLAQDPEGYARNCEALAAAQAAPVEQIKAATLLVAADEDAVAPVQVSRSIAQRLNHGQGQAHVEVLARCGHWMTFERASECQVLIRQFLEGLR
jgi:pimeloyl-ACP methyl ester carboxylesterase